MKYRIKKGYWKDFEATLIEKITDDFIKVRIELNGIIVTTDKANLEKLNEQGEAMAPAGMETYD